MSSTAQGSTPAGWYTDPADDTGYRWWDGSTWTTHTRRTDTQDPGATAASASPVATVTEVRVPEARHAAPVPAVVPSVELQPFAPLVPTPSPTVTSSAALPVQEPAGHTDGGAIAAYQAPPETGWSGFGPPPPGTPGYGAPAYGQPGFGAQGYGDSPYGSAYAQPAPPVPPAPAYQAAPFAPVAGYASPPPPGLPPFTGAAYPATGGYPTPGYPTPGYPASGFPAPGYPAGNGYPAAGYAVPYGYSAPTGVATDVKWLPWLGILAVLVGFLGLFGFLGVFSVVQASRVRRRIAMTGEPGEGRAVAGLVLGIIGLVLWVGNLVLRAMTTSF